MRPAMSVEGETEADSVNIVRAASTRERPWKSPWVQ